MDIGSRARGRASRPNIVFILADDLGYGDIRCLNPEHGKIPTPHVDRLATQGMTFTDAHSGSSLCTPTRYGILTGRYAWRTRLQSGVLAPYDAPLIAPDRLTVPGLLCEERLSHGVRRQMASRAGSGRGRARSSSSTTRLPRDRRRGFHHYFGTDVPNYPPYGFLENDRLVAQPTAWCLPDAKLFLGYPGPMVPGWQFDQILPTLTAKAVEYVGRHAADEQPFFLYFALTSPHEPIAPSRNFGARAASAPWPISSWKPTGPWGR